MILKRASLAQLPILGLVLYPIEIPENNMPNFIGLPMGQEKIPGVVCLRYFNDERTTVANRVGLTTCSHTDTFIVH